MKLSRRQIEKFRKNPTLAAEQLLNVKLHWWQKLYINSIYLHSRIDIPRNYYSNNYKQIIRILDKLKIEGDN
jgi:hypothetical protein